MEKSFRWTAPDPEQLYRTSELRDILIKALRELRPILRTVFVLRDIEGLSIAQTAEVLNLSHSAVKARLWRGRLQLRECLNRYFRKEEESAPVGLNRGVDNAEELRLQGAASTSGCRRRLVSLEYSHGGWPVPVFLHTSSNG